MKTDVFEKIKKVCPECNSDFLCYSGNCWCGKLPNIMPLKEHDLCLCPVCLETAIEEKIKKNLI